MNFKKFFEKASGVSNGVLLTEGVAQRVDPARWKKHCYGLPQDRWAYLNKKTFWITGAGTGYGRCISIALASAGAQVFLTGRRKGKLENTIEEMQSLSISTGDCHLIDADITDASEVQSACDRIRRSCSSLYGLVNNAALPPVGLKFPLHDLPLEDWDRIMRTNVTAPWLLTREIFPLMKAGGAARVLFVTSEAGWSFTRGFGEYNVSKAALNSLSASMAHEYASRYPEIDVQINALVPGEAKTEMNQNSTESPYSVVSMALILLSHPNGGPNGKFFHRDGRHLQFAYSAPFDKKLI